MKRIPFVILIWLVLVGGLTLYMDHRDSRPVAARTAAALDMAGGRYSVEVTPSFAAEADPFALAIGDAAETSALSVTLRGRDLLSLAGGNEPGVPLEIANVEGVTAGDNEILLRAAPPPDAPSRRHFVQVRVLRDGLPLADETFWSEGGARVEGVLRFAAPSAGEGRP